MKNIFAALFILTVVLFAACAKKTSSSKSVAEKATLYSTDIVPLLQAKCSPCHLPTKGGFKADFENYESAKKYGAEMIARVELNPGDRGFMPFKKTEKLSVEEIAVFKKWVAGGMLEK